MTIPTRLSDWTFETIQELCAHGVPESDRHDFKGVLPKPEVLTKLGCAFANTYGGYVVVGVHERDNKWWPDGVDPDQSLYGQFVQKLRAEPGIDVGAPRLIAVPGNGKQIYVFEVPRSTRRPHLPIANDERVFWKRVGSECVQMSREEVRAQMAEDETRRELLGLLLMELRNIVWSLGESAAPFLGGGWRIEGTAYSFEIIDRVTVEAYSLLKDDPDTVRVLTTLKKQLADLNADSQRNLAEQSYRNGTDHRRQSAENHRKLAEGTLSVVVGIQSQIEESFARRFSVSIPK